MQHAYKVRDVMVKEMKLMLMIYGMKKLELYLEI